MSEPRSGSTSPLASYALGKPGAWADQPWEGDHVAKVGPKIFCFLGEDGIGVKCGTRAEADEWIAEYPDDASVCAYIGRHGWNTAARRRRDPARRTTRGRGHLLRPRRRHPAEVQAPAVLSARGPPTCASREGPAQPVFCSPAASPLMVSSSGRFQPAGRRRSPCARTSDSPRSCRWLSMSTNGRRSAHRRVQVRLALQHLLLVEQPSTWCRVRASSSSTRSASSGRPPRARNRCASRVVGLGQAHLGDVERAANTGHSPVAPRGRARGRPRASSPLPEAVPAGQVDPGHRPGEHPRDRPQVVQAAARLRAAAPGRAGPEPQVGEQVQRAGHREEVGEARAARPAPGRRARLASSTVVGQLRRTAPRAGVAGPACAGASVSSTARRHPLEVLLGDPDVGVAGEDHLALLGDLEPAVDRARGWASDRAVQPGRRRGRGSRRGRGRG